MTRKIKLIHYCCALLVLALWSVVHANDLNDARLAYEAGEYEEAFTLLRPLAQMGNVDASFLLGHMYEIGQGVKKDRLQAEAFYQRSVDGGHVEAKKRLTSLLNSVTLSDSIVVAWYLAEAQAGDAEAQYQLGYSYEIGNGVKSDDQVAIKWYRRASAQEHDWAQLRLGMMVLLGIGTVKNQDEGIALLHESAINGNRIAEYLIQEVYEIENTNFSILVQDFRLALPDNESLALNLLEQKLAQGMSEQLQTKTTDSVHDRNNINSNNSVLVGASSLSLKHIFAQYLKGLNLGSEFTKQLVIAARTENDEAQFVLGVLHILGYGVNKDIQEGLTWIRKSATKEYKLANDYLLLWGNQYGAALNDETIALSWLKQSARKFNITSFYMLGVIYEQGRGVKKSLRDALTWYRLAASAGHVLAEKKLFMIDALLINENKISMLEHQDNTLSFFFNASRSKKILVGIIGASLFFMALGIIWKRRLIKNYFSVSQQNIDSVTSKNEASIHFQYSPKDMLSQYFSEKYEAQFESFLTSGQKTSVRFSELEIESVQVGYFLTESTESEATYGFMGAAHSGEQESSEQHILHESLPRELSLVSVDIVDTEETSQKLAMPIDETCATAETKEGGSLKADMQQINKRELALAEVYYNVGIIHATGDGVPINHEEAFRWFGKSSQEGLAEADYQIGKMMIMGLGVLADSKRGKEMLDKSARQGCQLAIDYLAILMDDTP